MIGVVGGLGDVGVFRHSSAPFAASLVLARLLTALTVAVGLGLVPACALAVRRHDRAAAAAPEPVGPRTDLDVSADLIRPQGQG